MVGNWDTAGSRLTVSEGKDATGCGESEERM